MRTSLRLLCTALLTTLVLLGTVTVTSANRLSISEQGFTTVWPRESQFNFSGSGFEIACEITLEGSFHYRTFLKTRSLVGHTTRARVGPIENCRKNGITAVTFLGTNAEGRLTTPWHLLYESFRGTLPRISGIRLALVGFEVLLQESIFGESCLYRSTSARPLFGIVNVRIDTGAATGLTGDSASEIPYNSGGFGFCPSSLTYAGTAMVTGAGSRGTLTIRLI